MGERFVLKFRRGPVADPVHVLFIIYFLLVASPCDTGPETLCACEVGCYRSDGCYECPEGSGAIITEPQDGDQEMSCGCAPEWV